MKDFILRVSVKNMAANPQVTVEGTLPPKITKILLWNKENSLNGTSQLLPLAKSSENTSTLPGKQEEIMFLNVLKKF